MILDPINSITSVAFYRKVAKQSAGRSLVYLGYLALLFAVAATWAVKVRVMPVVAETFDWLEKTMPPLTFSGGKLSTPLQAPLTVRHPKMASVGVIIDSNRTEPVTPQMLEQNNVVGYLTGNALYVIRSPGQLEVYDFSKTAAAGGSKPTVIDGEFYRNAAKLCGTIIYPSAAAASFLFFLAWKLLSSLIYSMVAMMINASTEAKLAYAPLFNISVYAQTLITVIQAMLLFIPGQVPMFSLAALIITGVYLWLAIKTNGPTAALPA